MRPTSGIPSRRHDEDDDDAPVNLPLREIAGRLKRLSFRDMMTLSEALGLAAVLILKAADELTQA